MTVNISNYLSVVAIGITCISRFPQIIKLLKTKSSRGVSLNSLLFDLLCQLCGSTYHYVFGHDLLTYLELPLLSLQQLILIAVTLHYSGYHYTRFLMLISACIALVAGFIVGVFNGNILTATLSILTPLGVTGKILQIRQIVITDNADNISLMSWFLNIIASWVRIYTFTYVCFDKLLITKFSISSSFSCSVFCTALYYRIK